MSDAEKSSENSSGFINQELVDDDIESKCNLMLATDEIPGWLTNEFIQNILQNHHQNKSLTVKCLKIQQCGAKGESYASIMYRIGTYFCDGINQGTTKFESYIAKTLPTAKIAIEKLGSANYNVQNKEMEMYQKSLPEFKRLLDSINEDSDFFPNVLAVVWKHDVIILEDLVTKKFVMADRLVGLDMDHIKMALRKLARMHAASAMILAEDPSAFAHLDTGLFTRKTDVYHVMYESLCEALVEEVNEWDGYEYYAKKLNKVRNPLVSYARRSFDCDDGDFHVLIHGDLWTTNMMYKYDDAGAPTDCVMYDYQFACVGSPALDLIVRIYKKN
jgi:hypothetical protein